MGRGRPPKRRICVHCGTESVGVLSIRSHQCQQSLDILAAKSKHHDSNEEDSDDEMPPLEQKQGNEQTLAETIEPSSNTETLAETIEQSSNTETLAETIEPSSNSETLADKKPAGRRIRYTRTRVEGGNKALIAYGYRYRLKGKPSGGNFRWICSIKHCPGTAYTKEISQRSISYPEERHTFKWRGHNHDSNEAACRSHEAVVEYKVSWALKSS